MANRSVPQFATLGEMLRYLRRRARLTQRELSIAVGYSESHISRIEQNERMPDKAALQALFAPALGVEGQAEIVQQLLALATAARIPDGEAVGALDALPDGGLEAGFNPVSNPGLSTLPVATQRLTNLPVRLTSFIGRQADIETLCTLISSTHLVTLSGVGGVGKSSLARQVAARLIANFRDGVWWVELAALTTAQQVPQAIATVFKLPEPQDQDYVEKVTTYLRNQQLLLILDNCEHLIDGCAAVVDALLRACPALHILTTSRELLRVEGEVERPVAPLATPPVAAEEEAILGSIPVQQYDAVRLFVERASVAQPAWRWDDAAVARVVFICTQLDGIPLAIELAASRLKGMTLPELATRLQDRFRLLTGGLRTALPRHQTLRATIDWSYELLTAGERTLLRRLAIFVGGWTLAAAEAVAGSNLNGPVNDPVSGPVMVRGTVMAADAADLLLQLVNKSLVAVEMRGEETRYRLLETIRHYAAEKLLESGEAEWMQAQHFAYFLALAAQSHEPSMAGRRLLTWIERISVEMENLRAALRWSQQQTDGGEKCLRLAGALWLYWRARGGFGEGRSWLEDALRRGDAASPSARAVAYYSLAGLLQLAVPAVRQYALANEALALCRQENDHNGLAHTQLILGEIAWHQGELASASTYTEEALAYFQTTGATLFAGTCRANLSDIAMQMGQTTRAIVLLEELLAQASDDQGYLFAAGFTSYALRSLFQTDKLRGSNRFQQELARVRKTGNAEMIAMLLHFYSRGLLYDGEPDDLAESLRGLLEALAIWRQLGIKWSQGGGIARACFDLGDGFTRSGDYVTAIAYEREACRLYAEVGDLHGVAWAQMKLGFPALELGDLALARANFRSSIQLYLEGSTPSTAYSLLGLAEIARRQGNWVRAGLLSGAAAQFEAQFDPQYVTFAGLTPLQAARTHLALPEFAAAWEQGNAMPLAEAVALALAETG